MPRKLPPLNALRAFEAAARHSSFTRASDELHVTHGAISQQVKALEEYYRQPLFSRSKGKVVLNVAGEKLLPVISQALDRLEKVSSQLRDNDSSETLTVHLTAAFAGQWLIPRLSDFQRRHPNLTIRLSPSHTFTDFQEAEADVAIRSGATPMRGVAMEKLFDVDTFAACAPSLAQGEHGLSKPDDLKHHTLIHDDDGEAWQALLDEVGVDDLDQGKGLFYADVSLALQVAIDGQGVIVAGSILAARDLAAGRLVIPFNHFLRNRNAYYLYYPQQAAEQAKVQAFREWLMHQVATFLEEKHDLEKYIQNK